MKVALINDYPKSTGIGNYAFSLFDELKNKLDIEMVYLNHDSTKELNENVLEIKTQFNFPFFNKTLKNLFFFPKKIPEGFDLYHCSNQFLSRITKYRKPTIISCMDIIPYILKNDYPKSLRVLLTHSLNEMHNAKKIITISDYTKKELIKHFGFEKSKIQTIYLGFNKSVFKPRNKYFARGKLNLPKDKKIILSVGSEEPRKNIETILEILPELKKEFSNILFLRIGEQSKKNKKLIKKLGIEKNVQYLAGVNINDLGHYYNTCDLFVFPSYYEGFGLPVLEAMASGVPFLTTNCTSIPEITGNKFKLLDPFNKEEWIESVIKALNEENRKRVQHYLKQAKEFSWEKCGKETLQIYNKLI